jgi:hypothetical protein
MTSKIVAQPFFWENEAEPESIREDKVRPFVTSGKGIARQETVSLRDATRGAWA